MKARNSFVKDNVGYIQLSNGEYALVDLENFERLNKRPWQYVSRGYAFCSTGRSGIYMHHEILPKGAKGIDVDHVNRNRLDNRRSNLVYKTHQLNVFNSGNHPRNTSGIKGVSWCKRQKRWRAHIQLEGRSIHLGYFRTKPEAVMARLTGYYRAVSSRTSLL